jgi:hypothetical protein
MQLRDAFCDHHVRVSPAGQLGHRTVLCEKQRGEVRDAALLGAAGEKFDERGRQANPSPFGRDSDSDVCYGRPVSGPRQHPVAGTATPRSRLRATSAKRLT